MKLLFEDCSKLLHNFAISQTSKLHDALCSERHMQRSNTRAHAHTHAQINSHKFVLLKKTLSLNGVLACHVSI
jgi:hypothetical protein